MKKGKKSRDLDFFVFLFFFHLAFIEEIECFMILHKRECIDVGAQIKISKQLFGQIDSKLFPSCWSYHQKERSFVLNGFHPCLFPKRKLKVNQKTKPKILTEFHFDQCSVVGHFFFSSLQRQHVINATWNECMLGMYLKLSMQNMYKGANCECNALNGTVFVFFRWFFFLALFNSFLFREKLLRFFSLSLSLHSVRDSVLLLT